MEMAQYLAQIQRNVTSGAYRQWMETNYGERA